MHLPRECIRYSSPELHFGLRPGVLPRPLYAARFSNRRAEDATALCYQRVSLPSPLALAPAAHGETFSPRAICRRQCALPRDSRRLQDFARPVCLFSLIALPFLNAELSPSALPPVPPSPTPSSLVAAVSRPRLPSFRALYSLGAFYVLLFCPVIIYIPGNIALPLSRGSRLC